MFYSFCDELAAEGDLIFKGSRLFIPAAIRPQMIERAHSSHIGINGYLRRAREVIFWPGMSTEIELHVCKCNICERYQSDSVKEPLISHEVPKRPWEKIGVDLMVFKQQQYLVTVDYFSNYFEIDRLDGKKSSDVIYKPKQHFARHGLPVVCHADNGPPFNWSEFRLFANRYEFEHITSSPRYAQSNGNVEWNLQLK